MASQIFGPSAVVSVLNRALTNTSTSNAVFNNQVEQAGTTDASQLAFAQVFGAPFAVSKTAADLSALLMTNMGLDNALLAAALTDYIAANGTKNVGIIAYQLSSLLSNLENDATYGASAKAWNSEVTAAYEYSANPLNTTSTTVEADGSATGKTFTLTTGVDIKDGTAGNDTFIADNTDPAGTGALQLTVADQINGGAGTDTLKVFLKNTATGTGQPTTLTSIENVYINGGNISAYTAATGTTGLSIDSAIVNDAAAAAAAAAGAVTYTLAGQSLTLANSVKSNNTAAVTSGTNTTTVASATDTAQNITVSNYKTVAAGATAGVTATQTLDIAGAKVAALNLTSTGAANTFTLTNTGTALTTVNIAGDKNVTITESINGLKTINASAATGNVSLNASGATLNAAFAFTGGAGNDTLTLKAGALALLTAGSQLDGGAGNDTLVTSETAALTAAQAAKVNATKGFEVLGFGASGSGADVSTLTSISQFKVAAGNLTETFTNANALSKFTIDTSAGNTGTVSIANKVGETSTSVTLDSGTATSAVSLATLTLTGITNVALTSTGAVGNTITTLNNADNSAITITGAADLTLATVATAIGSKVDGSAATGKLTITGNATAYAAGSSLGDTLIGGSAADTLKASINNATLTGNGGNDKFDVSVAKGGAASLTTITDFTKGDLIQLAAGKGTEVFTKTKVDVSAATTLAAALDLASAGDGDTTNGIVKWFQFDSATYVVADNGAGAAFATTDFAVKLVGTLDLSTAAFDATANTLTFA